MICCAQFSDLPKKSTPGRPSKPRNFTGSWSSSTAHRR
jgi:hypothetical protein